MIRLQDMTPEVYYQQSRDFQFIGRLFDVVLNAVKTKADTLYENPLSQNSDARLIDLMTMTLGFKSKHNYNVKQLTALCSAFMEVIKNKGNLKALELATNTLLNADGVTDTPAITIFSDKSLVEVSIPEEVSDINLFLDLLNYILPAGMLCTVIRESRLPNPAKTSIVTSDSLKYKWDTHTAEGNSSLLVNNELSILPQFEDATYADAFAHNTPGIIANTLIWKPEETENTVLTNVVDTRDNNGD